MNQQTRTLVLVAAVLFVGVSTQNSAWAGTGSWPFALGDRPLTLSGGMIELRGDTLRINLSDGAAGDPISLAPDLFYGVNNKLTVGLTHEIGICLNNDCGYNDFGFEAIYGLAKMSGFAIAAQGGLIFPSTDPFGTGIRLGLVTRLSASKLSVVIEPKLYIGFVGRSDVRKEVLDIPVEIQYQAIPKATVQVFTGLTNGTFDGFGDNAQIPLGIGATYVVIRRFDVGADFVFTNVLGPQDGKLDGRTFVLRAALRMF